MLRKLKLYPALLAMMASGAVFAADITWNFDDASQTNNFLLAGSEAGTAYIPTEGNPATGGFLELLPALDGRNCVLVFPDVDGFPVKAFHMTVDLRAGNDSGDLNARPADGFSISYCREGDPILANAATGSAFGSAGGDSDAEALSAAGGGTLESGTKTGVAIVFDAWQGNRILNSAGQPAADTEGIAVRVDDRTVTAVDMSATRNGNCYGLPDGLGGSIPDPACAATVCTNGASQQTGPSDGVGPLDANGNLVQAGTGAYTNLCWAPLDVELTADKKVTVIWKGRKILDQYQITAPYAPHRGRLVLMGRNGGNNQNVHFDNLRLVTVPATEPLVNPPVGTLFGFISKVEDNGPSVVNSITSVLLDGVEVRNTPQCTVTKAGSTTTVTYAQVTPQAPGTTRSVRLTYTTSIGQTLTSEPLTYTVVNYTTLSPLLAVSSAGINQNSNGFVLEPIQTTAGNPNRNYWTDEQLFGLRGPNLIDFSLLFGVFDGDKIALDQSVVFPPVIDFDNGSSAGQFAVNAPFTVFGVPAGTYTSQDNSALAISSYLYFPQAGLYTIGVNSDDGLRLTFARNAGDVLGQQMLSFDGGRGIGNNQNTITLYVQQAGYYGTRLIYYNGGGGAGVEYYTTATPATNEVVLINDLNSATSVKSFRTSTTAPAYYSLAEPPLQHNEYRPDRNLIWEITDAGTTLVGNPSVKVDGVAYSPVITHPQAGVTHFEVAPTPLWASGTRTIDLSFQDSAGSTITNRYTFSVIQSLSMNLWSAVGSGSNPGFRMMGHQNPITNILNGWRNMIQMANQVAEGLYRDDVSDRTPFNQNGEAWISTILNFSQNDQAALTENGNFRLSNTPSIPDVVMPGFGVWTPNNGQARMNNEAAVFRAFVEFPAAGVYTMGVNSDDGFRITVGDSMSPGKGLVYALAPASVRGDYKSLQTQRGVEGGAFGGPLPAGAGTIAQAVVASPLLVDGPLVNAAAINGKIAICKRGAVSFVSKVTALQAAGAVAVIIVNNNAFDPGILGGDDATLTVPVITLTQTQGDALLAAGTTGLDSPLILRIGDDASQNLGQYQGGKGASDVTSQFYVPAAGLWPLRLVWFNGGGDCNLEWFTTSDTGVKTPINDASSPVKAWIARTTSGVATLNKPVVSGNNLTLSWNGHGELEMAFSVGGPWIKAPIQTNPQTMPMIPTINQTYYRVRNY